MTCITYKIYDGSCAILNSFGNKETACSEKNCPITEGLIKDDIADVKDKQKNISIFYFNSLYITKNQWDGKTRYKY